ncbi:GEM-like protein 5 isoform X2 [Cryptomeria japonica]|uniref:GEM-like protein 5 isoform X2 n=1 Tax=Cryptomeria japonica TaxID=3369 RepID=UPI0027DA8537|nr:GEM-like protein 5 isoform X2 [Cryptomeria japonica]
MGKARSSIDETYKELLLAEYHSSTEEEEQKWSFQVMGVPAPPFEDEQKQPNPINPYILQESPPSNDPMEKRVKGFNKLSKKAENLVSNAWKKAENLASNVWVNCKSVPKAALGKMSMAAKALRKGGFKSLYKHTFHVQPHEKLRKTYACYLSTSTGPVGGTLFISTHNVSFCSDRPLSLLLSSGKKHWAYYRVAIPVAKVKAVESSVSMDDPAKKYIEVVTVDDHEFWLMGFIKYHKALNSLSYCLSLLDDVS